jgi:hypothetical protein
MAPAHKNIIYYDEYSKYPDAKCLASKVASWLPRVFFSHKSIIPDGVFLCWDSVV